MVIPKSGIIHPIKCSMHKITIFHDDWCLKWWHFLWNTDVYILDLNQSCDVIPTTVTSPRFPPCRRAVTWHSWSRGQTAQLPSTSTVWPPRDISVDYDHVILAGLRRSQCHVSWHGGVEWTNHSTPWSAVSLEVYGGCGCISISTCTRRWPT